jgi:hypothetical protein
MHTIQYVAIQADSSDTAFEKVRTHLDSLLNDDPESYTNTWFDWFVTGGGRWAKVPEAQYNEDYRDEVAKQGTLLFAEYLDKAKEFRQTSLDEYVEQAKKVDYNKIINDINLSSGDDFRAGMELYPIKKIYDMAMGMWDYNSYYYDIINDSANMIHLKNKLDNGDKNWYLVPVDFHF